MNDQRYQRLWVRLVFAAEYHKRPMVLELGIRWQAWVNRERLRYAMNARN